SVSGASDQRIDRRCIEPGPGTSVGEVYQCRGEAVSTEVAGAPYPKVLAGMLVTNVAESLLPENAAATIALAVSAHEEIPGGHCDVEAGSCRRIGSQVGDQVFQWVEQRDELPSGVNGSLL